jgi:solute carrier family 25 (mitochondrial phosphate transporter), member 23/24/25/41
MDENQDGQICFAEWRDFLLLLPRPTSMPAIFEYYQAYRPSRPGASQLTQDGDVTLHEKPAQQRHVSNRQYATDIKGKKKAEEHDEGIPKDEDEEPEQQEIFSGVGLDLSPHPCAIVVGLG